MSKVDLRLDWCSYEAAKFAVEHWHYSKSMPMPPIISIGAWESNKYIGCVLFSRGTAKNLGSPYGLENTQVCELTRVALSDHKSPVSRVLSIAVKMLSKKEIGLRLIVSYADTHEGHHGGIYQAAGWLYSGTTAAKTDYVDSQGKRWMSRQISESGLVKQFGRYTKGARKQDVTPVKMPPKYRYLFPLDDAMRKQIEPLRKPYPKRERGEIDSAADSNLQTEGASPIRSLLQEAEK